MDEISGFKACIFDKLQALYNELIIIGTIQLMLSLPIHWYDLVSIVGVTIILYAYFFLQLNRLEASSYLYSTLNLIGSLLILFSLYFDWNLSAVIIEVAWVGISVLGIIRRFLEKFSSINDLPIKQKRKNDDIG
jgi:hypothetical protein